MCTVAMRLGAEGRVDLLAVRDEFLERPTSAMWAWWPSAGSAVIGMRDERAGGTALAFDRATRHVAMLVNAAGEPSAGPLRTRGFLAVDALVGAVPVAADLTQTPGFHLLVLGPGHAEMWTWDARELVHHRLSPGDHVLTNPGLDVADPPGSRTREALRASDLLHDPASWHDVLAAAWVQPVDLREGRYGSRAATVLSLDDAGWDGWVRVGAHGDWDAVERWSAPSAR